MLKLDDRFQAALNHIHVQASEQQLVYASSGLDLLSSKATYV